MAGEKAAERADGKHRSGEGRVAAVLGLVAAGGNAAGWLFCGAQGMAAEIFAIFLALGAGYMLAVALMDIYPESVKLGGQNAFLLCWPDFS